MSLFTMEEGLDDESLTPLPRVIALDILRKLAVDDIVLEDGDPLIQNILLHLHKPILANVSGRCQCNYVESFRSNGLLNVSIETLISRGVCEHLPSSSSSEHLLVGFYPLHVAAAYGRYNAMKLMVEHGADINCTTFVRMLSPFDLAIYNQQHEVAKILIEAGFHYKPGLSSERTVKKLLTYCIRQGQLESLKLLFSANQVITHTIWSNAMLMTLDSDQCDIMDWLLDIGLGSVNDLLQAWSRQTALHMAQSTRMAELLLKRGADPTICDNRCGTALAAHITEERLDIAKAILDAYPKSVDATQAADTELHRYAPLHIASWRGNLDAVNLLLDYNASPHIITCDGNTSLGLACHADSLSCAERLIHCEPNIADKDGDTALIYATYNGNLEICRLLIEHDADPSQANRLKVTPLWNAVYSRSLSIVELLLGANVPNDICSKGCSIYSNDDDEHIYDTPVSPLFVAIHRQDISIARSLIESGCYLNHERYRFKDFDIYVKDWDFDNKKWLNRMSDSPPRLMWWCKRLIRRQLPVFPEKAVELLSIPRHLKRYLLTV